MKRRSGMSMAEVLVALFLMALGSIAILTMFPLGMFHMGQALKDDRTAQSAAQADAFMRTYWRITAVENGGGGEPFYTALDYPDSKPDLGPAPTPTPPKNVPPPNTLPNIYGQTGPSYPVFVDPMGYAPIWSQNTLAHQYWVGNQFYARRSLNLNLQPTGPSPQRTCSLMDGFGFQENGTPSASSGALERELRYNWLWVLQRPDNTARSIATMTVVVFDKRAFQYAPQNAERAFVSQYPWLPPPFPVNGLYPATNANTIVMQPLTTSISIPTGLGIPQVQKGGWIVDATILPPGSVFAAQGMRHAIFYRVVSVTDNPANGTTDIELQTPIRRLDGTTGAYPGTLIHMAGVSEVFERPNLTPYDF